jgi:hypothetical protein
VWSDLVPILVQALALIIPAVGTLVLALITRATLRIQAAKQAATAVELSPGSRVGALTSAEKLRLAVDVMRSGSSPLVNVTEEQARALVERVLPDVRRFSDATGLRPSKPPQLR